jgi:Tfp pilus assembly protein PilF
MTLRYHNSNRFFCRLPEICLLVVLLTLSASVLTLAQSDTQLKRLEHAVALINENRTEEAEKEVQAILKVAPNDSAALNLYGTIRAKQGRYSEAELLFTRAIRSDKLFVGPHLNLVYLYTLTGKPQKAVVELREVLRLEPQNAEALDRLARLLLADGQLDEGIKVLEEGARSQQLSSSLLVLRGDAYLKKGNILRGEESYKIALDQDNQSTDAVLGLAQAAQLKGETTSATALLARARKMVANSPDTLYRFAIVAMRAGLYEEANGILQAAIKMKSDDASYFLALGTTWIKKPDLIEAERAFRRALELQPDNSQAQMYLGYALLEQKKYAEAREWLEKSMQQDKTIPETFYYLGQIAQEQNEDLRAIEFFKNAIQLVPTYSFAHTGLGASYLRLKNYSAAQEELELSVKLNPNDPQAHYNLAVLFARLKNQQRAQEEMAIVERLKSAAKAGKTESTPAPITNPR